MGIENKKRYGVGKRTGPNFEVKEEKLEDLVDPEVVETMREMIEGMDSIVDSVTSHMRELREAGIRSPDPDDSLPDDEDTLRPGWGN